MVARETIGQFIIWKIVNNYVGSVVYLQAVQVTKAAIMRPRILEYCVSLRELRPFS